MEDIARLDVLGAARFSSVQAYICVGCDDGRDGAILFKTFETVHHHPRVTHCQPLT